MPSTEELLAPIAEAMASGHWLIAAFRVEPDPEDASKIRMILKRTTHSFPRERFGEVMLLLAKNLIEEQQTTDH